MLKSTRVSRCLRNENPGRIAADSVVSLKDIATFLARLKSAPVNLQPVNAACDSDAPINFALLKSLD